MQPLTFSLLAACLANIWVYFVVVPAKRYFEVKHPIKPVDCPLCCAWWFSCVYFWSLEGFLYAALAAIIARLIEKYI